MLMSTELLLCVYDFLRGCRHSVVTATPQPQACQAIPIMDMGLLLCNLQIILRDIEKKANFFGADIFGIGYQGWLNIFALLSQNYLIRHHQRLESNHSIGRNSQHTVSMTQYISFKVVVLHNIISVEEFEIKFYFI